MPVLALILLAVYLVLALGLRMAVQRRRTGSFGFRAPSADSPSVEWLAGVLLIASLLLAVLAPALDLAGTLEPLEVLDHSAWQVAGLSMYSIGLVGVLVSQFAMGDSWRVGVDQSEHTELVAQGPFAFCRNPIFTGMILNGIGLALLVGNVVAIAAAFALICAIELQVRVVEEPYLRREHGERYTAYSAQVGRFVPWFGRQARPDFGASKSE